MVSVQAYNRIVLAVVALGAISAVSGIILLIVGLSMPGTITLVGGIMMGFIAMMEWRCRDKPSSVILVTPPPLKEVVIVAA